VVVYQPGIDVVVIENPLPEIHWIDAEANRADPALGLQFPHRVQPFAQGPFGVTTTLVFDVVEVDDVEIVGP